MASLAFLPIEIKVQISSHLPQEDLYSMIFVSKASSEAAVVHLYRTPVFKTTYRFAQFVSIVSHCHRYADMVWDLNLPERLEEEVSEQFRLARWIEWKYKHKPFYAASPGLLQRFPEESEKITMKSHPRRNPKLWRRYGTVPVGLIIQILVVCKILGLLHLHAVEYLLFTNNREVFLHVRLIKSDYIVKSRPFRQQSCHP